MVVIFISITDKTNQNIKEAMKKFTLTILACLSVIASFAQAPARKTVVLDYFGKSPLVLHTHRNMVRAGVLTALTNSGRLNLIDASNVAALKASEAAAEGDVQPNADNIRMTAMKESGGNLLVTGNVTNVDATRERTDDGKIYYSGIVSLSLNIIDLETGNSIGAKDLSYSGLNAKTGSTRSEAIAATLDYIPMSMTKFVNDNFKIETKVVQINEEKKGKVMSVYINAGSSVGIAKAQTFLMFVESEIAGIKKRTEIGRLTVDTVEGEELTLCKVAKPSEDIKEYMNNGTEIIVISDREKAGATALKGLGSFVK